MPGIWSTSAIVRNSETRWRTSWTIRTRLGRRRERRKHTSRQTSRWPIASETTRCSTRNASPSVGGTGGGDGEADGAARARKRRGRGHDAIPVRHDAADSHRRRAARRATRGAGDPVPHPSLHRAGSGGDWGVRHPAKGRLRLRRAPLSRSLPGQAGRSQGDDRGVVRQADRMLARPWRIDASGRARGWLPRDRPDRCRHDTDRGGYRARLPAAEERPRQRRLFGDGAVEEGTFHESMNLAASRRLPVLFVCENNFYSSHLHLLERRAKDNIVQSGEAHGMPGIQVDGNDVLAVYRVATAAVQRARAGEGPSLLECRTYRWRGHVGPALDLDVGVRRRDDLAEWRWKDPLQRLEARLLEANVPREELEQLVKDIERDVEEAVTFARESPYPDPAELHDHVFKTG